MKKGYKNDMYDLGDFDQIKNKVCCSVCHTEGHTMNRHKEEPKRNPRPRGAVGRNHRSGASDIIEVTYTSNIEKLFNLLVCSNIICCTWKINFFVYSIIFLLIWSNILVLLNREMAGRHPQFPLLESYWDNNHRACLIAEQGAVSVHV
jgi:hypothetical protein